MRFIRDFMDKSREVYQSLFECNWCFQKVTKLINWIFNGYILIPIYFFLAFIFNKFVRVFQVILHLKKWPIYLLCHRKICLYVLSFHFRYYTMLGSLSMQQTMVHLCIVYSDHHISELHLNLLGELLDRDVLLCCPLKQDHGCLRFKRLNQTGIHWRCLASLKIGI